jgi:hypothetical protein
MFDRRRCGSQNPLRTIRITAVGDLVRVVIPHFERYPLKTKKKNDFRIWRQAVELLAAVQKRKQRPGNAIEKYGPKKKEIDFCS